MLLKPSERLVQHVFTLILHVLQLLHSDARIPDPSNIPGLNLMFDVKRLQPTESLLLDQSLYKWSYTDNGPILHFLSEYVVVSFVSMT